MSFFEAILLGLIQGITEFFPISSSGHLIIVEQLLGIESDYGVFFNVVLHIGTLAAVILAFYKDVRRLFYSFVGIFHDAIRNIKIFYLVTIKKQDIKYRHLLRTSNRKLLVLIIVSNVPTVIFGSLLYQFISSKYITLFVVGLALFVTGLLLFVVELAVKNRKNTNMISWRKAITIGAFQGLSVIPGISRLGTTLSVGMFCGLSKSFSIKYSFLISIPTMIGAALFEMSKLSAFGDDFTFGFVVLSLIGAVIAFLVGSFAIKFMIHAVKNGRLRYFAAYCFILGILSIILN